MTTAANAWPQWQKALQAPRQAQYQAGPASFNKPKSGKSVPEREDVRLVGRRLAGQHLLIDPVHIARTGCVRHVDPLLGGGNKGLPGLSDTGLESLTAPILHPPLDMGGREEQLHLRARQPVLPAANAVPMGAANG